MHLIVLNYCFKVTGERVLIQDLNADHDKRNLEAGLPSTLHFNLQRENGFPDVKLELQENTRLNSNAPVYESVLMTNGKQSLIPKPNIPPIVRKDM